MTEFTIPSGDLLVAPEHAQWAENLLNHLASPGFAQTFTQKVNLSTDEDDDDFWAYVPSLRPYRVDNGVLTIPVQGMLLNGFPYQFGGMATGYDYIERAVARGVQDSAVREIVFDINSPGGTVARPSRSI